MRKRWEHILLLTGLILLAAISTSCSNSDEEAANKEITTGLTKETIDNEAFESLFPLHYESYLKNNEMTNENSFYGGSVKHSKFDNEVNLPILFFNYGFGEDYNEERGHTYALEDVQSIARITDKSIGSCMTCKSTAVPIMIEKMGDSYYSANFRKEIVPLNEELGGDPIGCSDCHDPETMELRVTRPAFTNAMAKRGIDVANASKNDMRSYVCGQCHVEYYFEPENQKVTYPWDYGFKPEDMYKYYETIGKDEGFDKDWTNLISGTPMLKAQHPDFETFSEGPHGKAGVACSDCHMPYERVENGKKKMSSHHWQSPLNTLEGSCQTCHADKSEDYLRNRIKEIQDTNMDALHKAQDISSTAHYYVNKMNTVGAPKDKIEEAQDYVRKGQWYWDIVAAESSAGFHNPQGAMNSLKMSVEASNQAIIIATEELVKKNVNIDKLKLAIEETKQAVIDEEDTFKKKIKATNDYFPKIE